MRRIIWSSVVYRIFPHYFIKGAIFGGKIMKYVCFYSLQVWFETFLIIRRIQRDMIINICTSSCKVAIILVRS